MKILKNKSGLILAETLIAVAMMAAGSIMLGSILTTANSNMRLSRDYLIARNLAVEGVEAVKGIRSTNRLMEPNDKSCWLRRDLEQKCNVQVEADGNYRATQNDKNQWILDGPFNEELNLEGGANLDVYQLYITDIPYIHDPTGEPSSYYRSVHFSEVNDDFASFEVKLQWREGQKVRTIIREFTISNYL